MATGTSIKLLTTDQKSRHHKTIPKKPSKDEHSQQGEKSLFPKRVQFWLKVLPLALSKVQMWWLYFVEFESRYQKYFYFYFCSFFLLILVHFVILITWNFFLLCFLFSIICSHRFPNRSKANNESQSREPRDPSPTIKRSHSPLGRTLRAQGPEETGSCLRLRIPKRDLGVVLWGIVSALTSYSWKERSSIQRLPLSHSTRDWLVGRVGFYGSR